MRVNVRVFRTVALPGGPREAVTRAAARLACGSGRGCAPAGTCWMWPPCSESGPRRPCHAAAKRAPASAACMRGAQAGCTHWGAHMHCTEDGKDCQGQRSAACLAAARNRGHAIWAAAPCSTCARSSAAWRRPSGAARRRGRRGRPWRPRRALAAARAARRRCRRCQTPRMRCMRPPLRPAQAQARALQRPADDPWWRPARCQTSTAVAAPPWCHWSAARPCAACARAPLQNGC
jgi:hypothetical protein